MALQTLAGLDKGVPEREAHQTTITENQMRVSDANLHLHLTLWSHWD